MIGIYVLLAVVLVAVVVCIAVVVMLSKKQTKPTDNSTLKDDIKKDVESVIKIENSMLTGAVNAQVDASRDMANRVESRMSAIDRKFDDLKAETDRKIDELKNETSKKFDELKGETSGKLDEIKTDNSKNLILIKDDNTRQLDEVRKENKAQLEAVRKDNAEQLEKMRQTVDEKLASTLDQRFNQSFKIVNDRLEEINRTFGELQNLQTGVNDLNKIFKNVKTRGTWGEVSLENLLQQILVPEQYEKQVRLTRGSDDMVDFVIKMPGKGEGEVLLPIDAKFPFEDYARLVEASEKGDTDGIESASKALALRIKQEAMSIRNKYIKPPKTTDFAIMYLPTEGLYAEIIRREGLVEEIQNNCRIVICGPTTIAALLNSLQMGFKSVAIEKRSSEIVKLMRSFTKDFNTFSDLLKQTGERLVRVQNSLQSAEDRTNKIREKLVKVSSLTDENEKEINANSEIETPLMIANADEDF